MAVVVMGTPFMIDEAAAANLARLKETAEANPITRDEMMALAAAYQSGARNPSKLNREQTVELPFGFTVTFTVEWQPMGMCRHMSVASPKVDRAPIEAAMRMVGEHLGFAMEEVHQFIEPMANGGVAVNVVEVMAPNFDDYRN